MKTIPNKPMVVEKNIPMPIRYNWKPVLSKMEIGDSIMVPHNGVGSWSTAKSLQMTIVRRKQECGGYRIWRIA